MVAKWRAGIKTVCQQSVFKPSVAGGGGRGRGKGKSGRPNSVEFNKSIYLFIYIIYLFVYLFIYKFAKGR